MPRDVDERKKRKALRKLRKAADLAEQGLGPPLTDWEKTFLEEVEARIETYGSAFADPSKGQDTEALSALQSRKLHEIDRKARGKPVGGFRSKKPRPAGRSRQINEDVEPQSPEQTQNPARTTERPDHQALRLVKAEGRNTQGNTPSKSRKASPPRLRLVRGAADEPSETK